MPLRPTGPRTAERSPYRPESPESTDYVATAYKVERVLEWYRDPWEHMERPGALAPDGWHLVSTEHRDGRVVRTISEVGTDAAIEVSFADRDGAQADFQARALTPDEAFQLAMDGDEESRARGFTIYNARHPKP